VALFAGTIAGSSAPAFVVDAQATEDKKDYKEKDRNYDKDSRYDDNKKYGGHDDYGKDRENKYGHDDYGKDRENKYGHDDYGKDRENKYSTYDRENRDKHDDKSSVKYIKCNNVNINGKDGHSDRGNDNWPRGGGNDWRSGGGNDWQRGGEENGFSHDSFTKRGDHNFPGFIKQTDKDVVVICIFNNDDRDKNMTKPPVKVPKDCIDCIEDLPGQFPSGMDDNQANGTGLVRDFVDALFAGADILGLDDTQTGLEILNEFCDNLEMGMYDEDTITTLVQMAIPGSDNANFSMALLQCLLDIIDKDNNHGNPHW
jgi:hypothetical protein